MDWPSSKPQYRVHVSGLARERVQRYPGGQWYDQEVALGEFFQNYCETESVSLMVDAHTERSRGFAFVDFADRDSFDKALTLNGTKDPGDVRLDPKRKASGLQVSPAKEAAKDDREEKQALQRKRDETAEILKDARVHINRINEVMQQIEEQRTRQRNIEKNANYQEEMQREQKKQDELQKKIREMRDMEASLNQELNAQRVKTRKLEELYCTSLVENDDEEVDATVNKQAPTKGANWEDMADDPESLDWTAPSPAAAAVALHRSISCSSNSSDSKAAPTDKLEAPAPAGLQRSSTASSDWAKNCEDKQMQLRRTLSRNSDVSRGLVDQKAEAFSPPPRHAGGNSTTVSTELEDEKQERPAAWAEMEDDEVDDFPLFKRGREVLIKGLPSQMSVEQLEAEMRDELTRFWTAMAWAPPHIESMQVKKPRSYSEAFRTPTVVTVKFADEVDASDLVENCNKDAQREMTIRGRKLVVEWPSTDCRRMGIRAPTDASSELSYETVGTHLSKSTIIAQKTRPAFQRPVPGGGAAAAPGNTSMSGLGKNDEAGNYVSIANRSVILSGLPTSLRDYDLRREVLKLLQREWRKANISFDEKTHLHKGKEGIESAIEVRPAPAHRPGDQNGGTVKIRFVNYADAKWLAESAKSLRMMGCNIRSSWANPRGQRGERR